MITRIAAHVADFSVRLKTNVRAIYQYCPIPAIQYDQLEDELFCHIYYLRHLCDTKRFADWPIQDPVALLKACLQAWHDEINRKPSNFSLKDACEVLGVDIANAYVCINALCVI
jgi:DnaJ family protein C protein 13